MIPIRQLLNRIRWDEAFGDGEFEIGYYDRVSERIQHLPFDDMEFEDANHFDFLITDPDGVDIRIPLHRIREVHKDGALIWHREGSR